MKIVVQLVAGTLLCWWPVVALFSGMAFTAPGTTSNKAGLVPVLVMYFYPALIGLGFYLLNWSFWFIPARTFLALTIALPTAAFVLLGYPRNLLDMFRGFSAYGYSKRAGVADPSTFASVGNGASEFWRDATHVYYAGKVVPDADPSTIRSFDGSQYACDDRHAYYMSELIPNSDGATFEPLSASFARDRARVYYLHQAILPGADATSFKLLPGESFGVDANKVYALPGLDFSTAHEVAGADPASFTLLTRTYAKDSRRVYYLDDGRCVPVPDADPSSFEATADDEATQSDARDIDHYYVRGKVVGAR